MAEWSEDHMVDMGPFKFEPWNLCLMLDRMKTGQSQLGGPVEHSEEKGGESVVAILRFLCGIPHLCRLRTERLVPVSKYRTYQSHASDMGLVS
jgi:hypothetical protein